MGKGLAVFLRWRTGAWGKGSKTYPGKEVKEKTLGKDLRCMKTARTLTSLDRQESRTGPSGLQRSHKTVNTATCICNLLASGLGDASANTACCVISL